MDYHVNRKVTLSQEGEFSSLYKWSLQEHDDSGKQIGRDQVPWVWSLVFTATETMLNEVLELETKTPFRAQLKPEERKDDEDNKITIEEREYIRAALRPGYFADPESGEGYSMFGTDRAIESFILWIYKQEDETKPERYYAWGSLSYTSEIDFRYETVEDTLQFSLYVSPKRFAQYVQIMRGALPSIMTLRLGEVDGLYSEWTPQVNTDNIKVLTDPKDHQLTIAEGCAVTPPGVGRIGQFSLTFTTRRDAEKPAQAFKREDENSMEIVFAEDDGLTEIIETRDEDLPEDLGVRDGRLLEDGELQAQPAPDESLMLQHAAFNLAAQQTKQIKYLSYAAWLIVGLLALLVLRL